MLKYERQEVNNICNKLLSQLAIAKERARAGELYNREYEANLARLNSINNTIHDVAVCVKHLDNIHSNIEHYAIEHQRTAKEILSRAIEEAGALVPDACADGVHLEYDKNSVVLVNKHGEIIDDAEGGGYRAVLGVTLRYALMKAQPGALPFMLFDEALFAIDDDTTQRLKRVLAAMKRDTLIIIVEQRRNVVDGIVDKKFAYTKDANELINISEEVINE